MNEKRKFLLQYYAIYFLKGFLFLKQYLVLLLNSNLTPVQVSLIISTFSIVSALVEIPTGAVSDYFGCKRSLVTGILFYLIGYVVIFFEKNFFTFCIFYSFCGLYETIFSGSKESLFYNNIKYLDIKNEFIKYKSRSKIIHYIALTMSGALAGMLLKYNMNYLILIDIFVLIIYFFVVLSVNEHSNENLKKLNTNYLKSIKNGFKYILKHRTLRYFILFEGVWYGTWMIFINYSSLFYKEIEFGFMSVGKMIPMQVLLVALMQAIFIDYFIKKDVYNNMILFLIGGVFCVLSVYSYKGLLSYILNIIYFFCIQTGDLLFYPKIQKLIPAKSRSIIVSISSFIDSMSKLLFLRYFGLISNKYSYQVGFGFLSGIYLILTLISFLFFINDKHLRKIKERL